MATVLHREAGLLDSRHTSQGCILRPEVVHIDGSLTARHKSKEAGRTYRARCGDHHWGKGPKRANKMVPHTSDLEEAARRVEEGSFDCAGEGHRTAVEDTSYCCESRAVVVGAEADVVLGVGSEGESCMIAIQMREAPLEHVRPRNYQGGCTSALHLYSHHLIPSSSNQSSGPAGHLVRQKSDRQVV